MKAAFTILVTAFLSFGCRTAPPVSPFGAGTKELVKKRGELNQAFALRDARALESLTAPEYVFHFYVQNATGAVRSRPNAPRGKWMADVFDRLSNGPLQWMLIDVRVHGQIGIVVSHYRWIGSFDGKGFQYEGYITDVWIHRSNRWRVLVSTANLLPPSP